MLELQHVVRHYRSAGEEIRAVDGVTLLVAPGEMVALEGPSGSGKTTLLLLTAALLNPERGTVRYGERDLSSLSEREAARYLLRDVGFIYQSPHLMPRVRAVENASVKLMLDGISMEQAQAHAASWLERVGLGDRLGSVPEELSGGECQRVAIARALAGEPGLILADEPTGNLDSARSRQIVELLRSIAHDRGAIVLLVTHDHAAASLADRRLYMRDGRLLDDGAPGGDVVPSAAASEDGAGDGVPSVAASEDGAVEDGAVEDGTGGGIPSVASSEDGAVEDGAGRTSADSVPGPRDGPRDRPTV